MYWNKKHPTSKHNWQFTLQVLSMEPVTMREQSQLNWTLLISPLWPVRVWTRLKNKAKQRRKHSGQCTPVCRMLRCESMHAPYSITDDTHVNAHITITMTMSDLPEATSHIATVWSKEPVTSWFPTVLKHRERTSAVWPWRKSKDSMIPHWLISFFFQSPPPSMRLYGWNCTSTTQYYLFKQTYRPKPKG